MSDAESRVAERAWRAGDAEATGAIVRRMLREGRGVLAIWRQDRKPRADAVRVHVATDSVRTGGSKQASGCFAWALPVTEPADVIAFSGLEPVSRPLRMVLACLGSKTSVSVHHDGPGADGWRAYWTEARAIAPEEMRCGRRCGGHGTIIVGGGVAGGEADCDSCGATGRVTP